MTMRHFVAAISVFQMSVGPLAFAEGTDDPNTPAATATTPAASAPVTPATPPASTPDSAAAKDTPATEPAAAAVTPTVTTPEAAAPAATADTPTVDASQTAAKPGGAHAPPKCKTTIAKDPLLNIFYEQQDVEGMNAIESYLAKPSNLGLGCSSMTSSTKSRAFRQKLIGIWQKRQDEATEAGITGNSGFGCKACLNKQISILAQLGQDGKSIQQVAQQALPPEAATPAPVYVQPAPPPPPPPVVVTRDSSYPHEHYRDPDPVPQPSNNGNGGGLFSSSSILPFAIGGLLGFGLGTLLANRQQQNPYPYGYPYGGQPPMFPQPAFGQVPGGYGMPYGGSRLPMSYPVGGAMPGGYGQAFGGGVGYGGYGLGANVGGFGATPIYNGAGGYPPSILPFNH